MMDTKTRAEKIIGELECSATKEDGDVTQEKSILQNYIWVRILKPGASRRRNDEKTVVAAGAVLVRVC